MKLPKQPLQIEESRKALAPYNFVELPEKVVTVSAEQLPDQDQFHTKRHTGSIECQLSTESPVYVRAARTLEQVEKKVASKDVPEFFYVQDINEPVIPGSTLRGMLRSLIEIASFGKVAEIAEKRLVYRAVGDTTSHGVRYRDSVMLNEGKHWDQDSREESYYYTPLTRAGYMRKRGSDWVIQPAQNIGGTTFARIRIDERFFSRLTRISNCKNACRIYVKVGPYEYLEVKGSFLRVKGTRVTEASATEDDPAYIAGTLARSGYMFSKKTEAVVYPPDEKAESLELGDELVDAYRAQISKEQENILGKEGVLIKGQPVFYTLNEKDEKKVEFFGHCRMLRLPYTKNPRDYVPEELRRESDIDLAEAIFGFTKKLNDSDDRKGKPKEKRYAGRVMVSDARLVIGQENVWLSPNRSITPRILASPKPTTFQHYLVQKNPNKAHLADYASLTPAETVIRGSKLYWHKGAVGLSDTESKGEVKEKQATKIKPLRAGVQFQFKVHFENLSQEELGALMWVLQIAADAQYRLKVGMGKPLGMGAVKIVSQLRLIDCKERYVDLLGDEDWTKGEKSEADTEKTKQEALRAFETFVLEGLDQKTVEQFVDLERIQQLLAMLSWPGPGREQTRYMEIERPDPKAKRGKRNEYKERPVLPGPLALVKGSRGSQERKVPPKQAGEKALEPTEGLKRGMVQKFGLGPKASFGFIKPNDGSADIFFHISQLQDKQDRIDVGTSVTYKERKKESGMEAIEIRIADR